MLLILWVELTYLLFLEEQIGAFFRWYRRIMTLGNLLATGWHHERFNPASGEKPHQGPGHLLHLPVPGTHGAWEAGKITQEGLGEVQEMIDICDFAVGLSRQLYGLTIASERPGHHMRESWQPLGVVGIISAFNFPVAVWSWNAALALVCGNPVIWKPSEKTPLTPWPARRCSRRPWRALAMPRPI